MSTSGRSLEIRRLRGAAACYSAKSSEHARNVCGGRARHHAAAYPGLAAPVGRVAAESGLALNPWKVRYRPKNASQMISGIVLDGYIYGFALTKLSLPFKTPDEVADAAQGMLQPFAVEDYPNLVALIEHALKPDYDYGDEFEFGLDLILDGLERAMAA